MAKNSPELLFKHALSETLKGTKPFHLLMNYVALSVSDENHNNE
ncbi:Uncharacterized protein dnm_032350 [Desulfonema magnum]|uniref:Uncharacterized protein n=1 Tax=Desulfonema magnum TaxID=45655 RepID=A0A975BLB2_9BACT|nr:Uncharacterized protein dnm_032350 [Desulfonema magnum]